MLTTLRRYLSEALLTLAEIAEPRDRDLEQALSQPEALKSDAIPGLDGMVDRARAKTGSRVRESCELLECKNSAAEALRSLADEVEDETAIGFRVTVTWHGTPTIAMMVVEEMPTMGEA